jgi:2-polyprenyl-3-methyl-5-hydroxy-6-metoxy-1,4-benzoquinol methylase
MEKIGMEYVNCNLCGADDAKIVYEWGKINVVRCRKCGLIYKNPRYPEEKILSRPEEDERIDDSGSAAKRQMFERQIVKIESLVGKGRILDVGCGQGDFLKIAMDRGWNAQGIEVSDRQYAAAKKKHGLNVFNGTIKQAIIRQGNLRRHAEY